MLLDCGKSTPTCILSLIKPLSKGLPVPLLRAWGEGAVSIHHFHYCFSVRPVEALIVIRGCYELNLLRAPVSIEEGMRPVLQQNPSSRKMATFENKANKCLMVNAQISSRNRETGCPFYTFKFSYLTARS